MPALHDFRNRLIRMTEERLRHLETAHPEMQGQAGAISEALTNPDRVVRSRADPELELYYKLFPSTPVTTKFLCVVVKVLPHDNFIVTAYYTAYTLIQIG